MCPLSAMQASPAGHRVNKHADHLPLYRQSQIVNREGLDLDRATLADWVGKSTALLEPLADAIHCPAVHVYMHERGSPCPLRRGDLRTRYACQHAGARHRQNMNRAALDPCPRRTTLGRGCTTCSARHWARTMYGWLLRGKGVV